MKKTLIIILVVIVLFGLYTANAYNRFITLGTATDVAWKQVEVDYQRRFDLIPNLVESVKGVMKQEQTVFTAIADARTKYSGAQTADEKAKAAVQVESSLGRLLAIVENYPQLKSSETVQSLMSQLEGSENRIAVARTRFNEVAQTYNLRVNRFPTSIFASIFGFKEKAYFEATKGSEVAPSVKF